MIKKIGSVSIALCSILLVGCNNTTNDEKNTEEIVDTVKISTDKVEVEQEELSYNLPSALQIAYVSRKSGAKYNASLLNNIENVKKYNTSNYKRAINFGVYSSDLANCLFNKKYQESKEYLKACKNMGASLGLNSAFESDNMAQRFDKNIANEDSVIKIVSSVQLKTDVMFEQNKQKHVTVIAFTGAWTESMYIALEVYAKDKNKKVLGSLLEQLLLSETVVKALKSHQASEPEMPTLISAVENINTQFNAITAVKAAIEKDEEMDFNAMSISDRELKTISESVKSLRTSMIN